ncbi:glycoside hydrolase family 13 protein [Halobacillus naozhouensis]|uniref:Glycoside hydrolase family 13 protein n=1 Tax=Halobacillus naozhouensis TaxID=554880 RepID=A0ABY8IZZ4_9BACI|nr:glycoside hydrolase family 13 protein [Halobacillus naozhouensis]WFT74753.1 glycoside hydrolase family 13 protein [Halobacillus naozhouensis]
MKPQDIYHNSFELTYREPFGAAPKGSSVTLTIDINHRYPDSCVLLHYIYDKTDQEETIEMDRVSEKSPCCSFETTLKMPEDPQLIWYFFEVRMEGEKLYYGRLNNEESGEGVVYEGLPPSWQITVYDPSYETPAWWKHATMYQIFPDRFHASGEVKLEDAPETSLMHTHWDNDPFYIRNKQGEVVRWDFFGGNVRGIIEKLDYIHSLGVTVIYLNPVFEAESNHRYDTGDYHKIDPLLGTKEEFEQLIRKADELGIEVMLDGVFSHTGSNSKYFNQRNQYDSVGAYQSTKSPYYSWYTFHDYPDDYEAWWGIGTLPTLNKEDKSYQDFLIHEDGSVIKTWQQSGVKHWRLDVADELTDDLIKQINKQLKKYDSSSVLLGEVWEDASNKTAYGKRRDYFLGGVLDSVMNYPLRDVMLGFIKGEVDAYYLNRRLLTLSEHYPNQYFYSLMNMLSTHDVERIKTLLEGFLPEGIDEKERADLVHKQIQALSLWLYTFPGIPSLYYGDEAGLTGGEDPDNRKPYPWGREDQRLISWYRTIGNLRKDHPSIRTGSWLSHAPHEDVYGYERLIEHGVDHFGNASKDDHVLYVMNRNISEEREAALPVRKGKWQNLLNKHQMFHVKQNELAITLKPCESVLLRRLN